MTSLRVLGLSYLATASLFTLAIVFSDHAALKMVTQEEAARLSGEFQTRILAPVLEFARIQDEKIFDPQARVALSPPGPNDARVLAHANVPVMPRSQVTAPALTLPEPTLIMPDLPEMPEPPPQARAQAERNAADGYGGSTPPPLPRFADPDAPKFLPPDITADSRLSPAERAAVTARLSQNLTPEMMKNFDLFLYVSKAKKGAAAQRLYVFTKDSHGALKMEYDWAASTGREQIELSPRGVRTSTDTPAGYYQLDPARMYRAYHSHAWDQSMPYAMFFNWENNGYQTGLAIHSATGDDIAKLGSRASAGCVHISPSHAKQLFELIRADYKGQAPRFAYNRASHTMSNHGEMMRDASGNLVMADGYKVLVDIEDFSDANMVAAMD
jgi:lipoprotein-anchoring transpeptidase ErfK/SrfK